MGYVRMNYMTFVSKEAADKVEDNYSETAPDTFPDATILVFARTGDTTATLTSVYPDKEGFERSANARKTRLASHAEKIEKVVLEEGNAALAFTR
ncbi:MAG: hypothetical protein ACPGRH_02530 [Alphaproteobacteria bacterium]